MKILAIDTATEACSAALLIDDTIETEYKVAPREHSRLILPMVQTLLQNADITLQDVDAIAFAHGPGSFTGLRIASGITQGLAFAANKPVVPISSLRAMAQRAYHEHGYQQVLVAIDARMHEIYWGRYRLDADNIMQAECVDSLGKAEDLLLPTEGVWQGVGTAWSVYGDTLKQRLQNTVTETVAEFYPNARDIAHLAKHEFALGHHVKAEQAIPVYLRNDVAKKSFKINR